MVGFRSALHIKVPESDTLSAVRKKRQKKEAAERPQTIRARDVYSVVYTYPDEDILTLDGQTLKDLQIFDADGGATNVFAFCKHTRNVKGAKVLEARMRRPLSSPDRITAVQHSITFMLDHLKLFEHLPTHVTTDRVEDYIHGILPLALGKNVFEFLVEVIEIRQSDSTRYSLIVHGAERTVAFIRALQALARAPEFGAAQGELAVILEEMRALLSDECFSFVAEVDVTRLNAWRLLRVDQEFRIYHKDKVHRLLELTYELDALLSMAITTKQHGLVMPELEETSLNVQAEGLFHPLVDNAVPNPLILHQEKRLLFLTGPNMAGKTTYLRASGVALYLAHLGMGVPAARFRFAPAQCLLSTINLTDNLSKGVSYFLAESRRIKEIASHLVRGQRVVAIMDEPFKGTNVKDTLDVSIAIMQRFANRENCLFMFSSHLIELEETIEGLPEVDCRHFKADENTEQLKFDYQLKPGISNQRLGMRVLQEEGVLSLLDYQGES